MATLASRDRKSLLSSFITAVSDALLVISPQIPRLREGAMSSTSTVSNITPLPPTAQRQAAVAQLHNHEAMIQMNPLVIRHVETTPPPGASADEAEHATWYEITDRINYLPGGLWSGEVSYKACFYNLPDGLQTHVFAPMGLDMRGKWSVRGNMPGEPREEIEMGVNAPREGLYILEDVHLRCNPLLMGFVKRNLKRSHQELVEKIVSKSSTFLPSPSLAGQASSRSHPHAASSGADTDASFNWPWSSETSVNREPAVRQELYGSAAANQCLCTGALHEARCPEYPNLRSP